jgi:N-acetyl-gamma-glutamyl-phosphate reductase
MNEYALMVNSIPVGVLGASGYAGRELCGLIAAHPSCNLQFATANERRGQTLRVRAGQRGMVDVPMIGPEDARLDEVALVFSALPHGASADWVARVLEAGVKVVDLSSDLRPGRGGSTQALSPLIPAVVPYGLPELFRAGIAEATAVANPGCYPTSILVALAPFVRAGLLAPGALVSVAAASGVSGAGASPKPELLFAEVTENFRAYAAGNVHRHLPEMTDSLARLGGDVDLLFTPHLLPVDRGILSTITVPLAGPLTDPQAVLHAAYAHEPFVEVADTLPALADVVHRNVVRVHAVMAQHVRTPTLLLFAAIDNLVKGAAGQAVQNANLMLGLDETAGLPR